MAKPLLEELVFGDWSKEKDSQANGDVLTGDSQADGDLLTGNSQANGDVLIGDLQANGDVLTGDLQADGDVATSKVADGQGTRHVYLLSSYCSGETHGDIAVLF